jgi:hypothetical protein
MLLSAIERRLGIADRLASCLADRAILDRALHGLAEMIRYRALLIAAGYPDSNDCDVLRCEPAFKMAVGRLPESGADLARNRSVFAAERCGAEAVLLVMVDPAQAHAEHVVRLHAFEARSRRARIDLWALAAEFAGRSPDWEMRSSLKFIHADQIDAT